MNFQKLLRVYMFDFWFVVDGYIFVLKSNTWIIFRDIFDTFCLLSWSSWVKIDLWYSKFCCPMKNISVYIAIIKAMYVIEK